MAFVNLRAGIALLLTIVVGVFAASYFGQDPEHELVRARLDDVTGLPVGAPVSIAGLEVGTVVDYRIGPGYSEIDIQFHDDVELRTDATLYKKRYSPLSGPHLEIDPGTALEPLQGDYIEHVVETAPIGDVLSDVSEALPAVRGMSENAQHRADEFRAHLNGPYQDYIKSLDSATANVEIRMHNRLTGMNNALKRSENMEFDVRGAITPGIDRAEELALYARDSLSQGKSWVSDTAQSTRRTMDDTKVDWSEYTTPIRALDDGQGLTGELLNKTEYHDDVAEITDQTRSTLRALVNWQMRVGLRGEYAGQSGQIRGYISVKAGRTNQYYYLELVTSSQGGVPDISVVHDQGIWQRRLEIPSKLRFTAQYARRFGPAVFRYGLKESTFGAGVNLDFLDTKLELSADIFEIGLQDRPHVKLAASYQLFAGLFVRAGMDDILNPLRPYTIAGGGNSQTLTEVFVGRDYFVGASLRFNDQDLAALMRIGGQALASIGL